MYNKTRSMILISLFAALTAVGAYIRIPVPPVPFTFQIFFVVMAGLILGSKAGFLSQVIYMFMGLAGAFVFSDGGGIGYVLKPTFGYIIGFAACAYIIGFTFERLFPGNDSFIKYIVSAFAGLFACYIIGVGYMYLIFKYVSPSSSTVNVLVLIKTGFLIFLPFDTLKIIIASFLAKEVTKRLSFLKSAAVAKN